MLKRPFFKISFMIQFWEVNNSWKREKFKIEIYFDDFFKNIQYSGPYNVGTLTESKEIMFWLISMHHFFSALKCPSDEGTPSM